MYSLYVNFASKEESLKITIEVQLRDYILQYLGGSVLMPTNYFETYQKLQCNVGWIGCCCMDGNIYDKASTVKY